MEKRDELTHSVIGAAIEVHREVGPGLLESVHQACIEEELHIREIPVLPQHRLPIIYKGKQTSEEFVLDLYFPEWLVVELKAVAKLLPVHEAQLLTYLKLSKTRVGLLFNFNVPVLRDGMKRMVL